MGMTRPPSATLSRIGGRLGFLLASLALGATAASPPARSVTSDPSLAGAVAPQSYTVVDLGALPGGGTSYGSGINAGGEVVGVSSSSQGPRVFLWSDATGGQDLGAFAEPPRFFVTGPGINDLGEVAGASFTGGVDARGNPIFHAFVWSPASGVQDLGTLPGREFSDARGINTAGQVSGSAYVFLPADRTRPANYVPRAFVWSSAAGMQPLGTFGGPYSAGYGINDSGQVVGWASMPTSGYHAFLGSAATGLRDLGTLGGLSSFAFGINDAGQVVGYSFTGRTESDGQPEIHAFLWDSGGGMQDLGALPSHFGIGPTTARAINDAGQVVGQSSGRAFLWRDGSLQDLSCLINANSGWQLEAATAINEAGRITGYGLLQGQRRAFQLVPDATPNCASNVTAQLSIKAGRAKFNRAAGAYRQTVQIRNVSGGTLHCPAYALDSLTAGVAVRHSTGSTACAAPLGSPHVALGTGRDAVLSPGERIRLILEFHNPANAPITYTPRVLAGPGAR